MYTPAQSKHMLQLTGAWIAGKSEGDVEELRDLLRFHEHRYYVLSEPLVSDFEYDMLYKKLEKIEAEDPESITSDSPTQRVAPGLTSNFPKRAHLVPMLSLENSYDEADLRDWDRKAKELSGLELISYCVEPKFDGASVSLLYERNMLVAGTTRGDGEVGDDITPNVKQIRSVPLSAKFSKYGIDQVEVRGEVMMNKQSFENYNAILVEEGQSAMANPRNAAAGSLRMKDSREVGRRNLEAFLYNVSFVSDLQGKAINLPSETQSLKKDDSLSMPTHHSRVLSMLNDLGFKVATAEMQTLEGIDAVVAYINDFETRRDSLPYEIDGMVIKVDDLTVQEKLGMTSHHPRWAMAYKFKARQATSRLLSVEYQVGRTGAVTPVAKIAPVQVSGVTVSSISVHNEDYITEKDLQIGDAIVIERSGDVIPQIVRSMPEMRTGVEEKIIFPTHCPVCNDALHKPVGEAVWRCINISCKAQVVERIIHFVSKDALDVKSFGEANVRRFYDAGIIADIPSIYNLNVEKLQGLEGFGEKSIHNLLKAIEESKMQPLHRLIFGLGIRYVGNNTAKTLAQEIENIFNLQTMNEETLQSFPDVGVKVASSIVEFFGNEDNLIMLRALESAGVAMEKKKKVAIAGDARFSGLTFLFTGTLSQLKRNDAEAMAEAKGGKILSGVSSKLTYLIVGTDAGSKLEKAKRLPGITILSEEDFIKMVE